MAKKESSSKSVTFDAIVRQIREKQFAPVYLLHGDEPFFIDRLCKMFEEGILEPDERDFNQVVLYGKDTTADMVLANAKQFPFGSPYRVVILKEAKELKQVYLSHKAEFVAIYGRRRVGKTFLVDEVLKGKITFRHAGLSPVDEQGKSNNLKQQLQHFYQSLLLQGVPRSHCPKNWLEAFFRFRALA